MIHKHIPVGHGVLVVTTLENELFASNYNQCEESTRGKMPAVGKHSDTGRKGGLLAKDR
jgi:hypothetical protein